MAADDFEAFVHKQYGGLVATARILTGDSGTAEDIVQDSLTRTYRRWSTVRRYDLPGAWTRRIVINACISHRRRKATEHRVLRSVATHSNPQTEQSFDDSLWSLVRELPHDQMIAIALRYGADLSAEAVATHLDITPTALNSLLYRARCTLRAQLIKEEMP